MKKLGGIVLRLGYRIDLRSEWSTMTLDCAALYTHIVDGFDFMIEAHICLEKVHLCSEFFSGISP